MSLPLPIGQYFIVILFYNNIQVYTQKRGDYNYDLKCLNYNWLNVEISILLENPNIKSFFV